MFDVIYRNHEKWRAVATDAPDAIKKFLCFPVQVTLEARLFRVKNGFGLVRSRKRAKTNKLRSLCKVEVS